ncbi:hypothetical protein TeGR_g2210 [Tetraparma gracilis]|uniref:FAD dependent oxidoreductase domain-containing protein n=1 Tax=Tetraparma gracilis TaxID=2962635 RepID=A0ABQ6MHN3_9STRA|nr:hypothetical protein TeGR_g2210 [Tetraparma gracilis]
MPPPPTLVLGSGVIGLRTALLLSRAGARVSVRSAGPSASGASPGAGGLWMPHACADPRVSRWAKRTLADYLRMHAAGDGAVEMVPAVALLDAPAVRPTGDTNTYNQPAGGDTPAWAADPALNFQSFSTPQLRWQAQVTGAHVPAVAGEYGNAWAWRGPVVDAPRNLGDMEREIVERGGRIDKESAFESADEARAAAVRDGCGGVVNCLGGAGGLLTGDGEVKLARGVLKIYKRPEGFNTAVLVDQPPLATPERPIYCIPRGDVVLVGGTHLEGDMEEGVREEEHAFLREHAKMLLPGGGEGFEEIGDWVGWRPVREGGVKLGLNEELSRGVRWVDNYGHGGSGWTIATGCAEDARDLILAE